VIYCQYHMRNQTLAQEIFLTAFTGMTGFRGHASIKT
jgi:hypothetical protein